MGRHDVERAIEKSRRMAENGDPDGALAVLRRESKKSPQNTELLMEAGSLLEDMGNTSESVGAYRAALEIDPNVAEAHYMLASALPDRAAFKHICAAVKLEPENSQYMSEKALVYLRAGHHDKALACASKAVVLERAPHTLCTKSYILLNMGRIKQSLRFAEMAKEMKNDSYYAHFLAGSSLIYMSRYREALECFDDALWAEPFQGEAHSNRGIVLRRLGRTYEAVLSFKRALELDPNLKVAARELQAALAGGRDVEWFPTATAASLAASWTVGRCAHRTVDVSIYGCSIAVTCADCGKSMAFVLESNARQFVLEDETAGGRETAKVADVVKFIERLKIKRIHVPHGESFDGTGDAERTEVLMDVLLKANFMGIDMLGRGSELLG